MLWDIKQYKWDDKKVVKDDNDYDSGDVIYDACSCIVPSECVLISFTMLFSERGGFYVRIYEWWISEIMKSLWSAIFDFFSISSQILAAFQT